MGGKSALAPPGRPCGFPRAKRVALSSHCASLSSLPSLPGAMLGKSNGTFAEPTLEARDDAERRRNGRDRRLSPCSVDVREEMVVAEAVRKCGRRLPPAWWCGSLPDGGGGDSLKEGGLMISWVRVSVRTKVNWGGAGASFSLNFSFFFSRSFRVMVLDNLGLWRANAELQHRGWCK